MIIRLVGKFCLNRKFLIVLILIFAVIAFFYLTKDEIKISGVLSFKDDRWVLTTTDNITYSLLIKNNSAIEEKLHGLINETVVLRGEKLGDNTILVFDFVKEVLYE